VTIAVELHDRQRVSVIDLVVDNGSVVSIPRFPAGWGINVENHVDVSPVSIFGGAEGSVVELGLKDLKCLFEIEDDLTGAPLKVSGKIAISTGTQETTINLRQDQIILERNK
jgi:hypothetical protein